MKVYEVELIREKIGEFGREITYANSWSYESVFYEKLEDAYKSAKEYFDDFDTQKHYDAILINEFEYPDDTVFIENEKLVNDDGIDWIDNPCLETIYLNVTFKDIFEKYTMSVSGLSRETGIPRSTLSSIIDGTVDFKNTSLDNAYKISKALDMKLEEMMKVLYCEF